MLKNMVRELLKNPIRLIVFVSIIIYVVNLSIFAQKIETNNFDILIQSIHTEIAQQKSPYDYYRSTKRFRLYDPNLIKDWNQYRSDLISLDRSWQHYTHNQFLERKTEFYSTLNSLNAFSKKRALVGLNYLLTGNVSKENLGESLFLTLKSEKQLIWNNTLNFLHNFVGSKEVKKEPGWIAMDIHIHTYHSFDGTSNLEQLIIKASERGFQVMAITDHDFFDDAQMAEQTVKRLKEHNRIPDDFIVISGMEISSRDGHILGLFLNYYIPPGLTAEQTVQAIHEQGGLAIAPHPFQPDFGLGTKLVKMLLFDGMVITGFGLEFQLSQRLAEEVKEQMAIFMDSDTHVENGLAWLGYTLVNTSTANPESVYQAIQQRRTKPVHRNIMAWQAEMARKKITHVFTFPFENLLMLRFTVENKLANLLFANRIQVHGVVPNLFDDMLGFRFLDPNYDFEHQIYGSTVIQGFSAYYGVIQIGLHNRNQTPMAEIRLKKVL